jgi:hypothetical protein
VRLLDEPERRPGFVERPLGVAERVVIGNRLARSD